MIALSSGVRCDRSGLLAGGPTLPVVDPVDELPGPKPELVEAAKPESDMPPPELPILLPKALNVAARLLGGSEVIISAVTAGEEVIIRGGGGSPDTEAAVAAVELLAPSIIELVTTADRRSWLLSVWLVLTVCCISMLNSFYLHRVESHF